MEMQSTVHVSNEYAQLETSILSSRERAVSPFYILSKRLLDLIFVLAVSPVLLPLLVVVSVLVRWASPGPIFFAQRRICLNGEKFYIWKFRTMCVNSEEVLAKHLSENAEVRDEWEQTHKLRNDPRITRLGGFLRKTSLDELPQFFNVLMGHMSIVGPRPIVDAEVQKYGSHFSQYCLVKPGLTGLWQVSGRSTLSYAQRVLLDRDYALNCSLKGDLIILLKTVRVVVYRDGAY